MQTKKDIYIEQQQIKVIIDAIAMNSITRNEGCTQRSFVPIAALPAGYIILINRQCKYEINNSACLPLYTDRYHFEEVTVFHPL